MLIDIGVNLSNSQYKNDIEDVLMRAQEVGVEKMVLTGTSIAESEAVISLCEQYKERFPQMLYCTVGIHPHEASSFNSQSIGALKEYSNHDSVVAIGETGLDFNRNFSSKQDQEKAFEQQIEIAVENKMPLFLHERDAEKRQLEILNSHINVLPKAVIHCFTGNKSALFSYLDLDLYIGITGWICDERRGEELQNIVKNIPLDRLMVETDAPYLLPRNIHPRPKSRRNEPAFLHHVIDGITDHRQESAKTIAEASANTAIEFFNLI